MDIQRAPKGQYSVQNNVQADWQRPNLYVDF